MRESTKAASSAASTVPLLCAPTRAGKHAEVIASQRRMNRNATLDLVPDGVALRLRSLLPHIPANELKDLGQRGAIGEKALQLLGRDSVAQPLAEFIPGPENVDQSVCDFARRHGRQRGQRNLHWNTTPSHPLLHAGGFVSQSRLGDAPGVARLIHAERASEAPA